MKKGISPLVAAVLLIAATMSIAGILAYWASSFVRIQTEAFENQSVTSECNYADFRIRSCSYNTSSQKITLLLENIRDVTLKDLSLYVFYTNGTVSSPIPINDTLIAKQFKSFFITTDVNGFSRLTIKTNCPDKSESSSCGG